MICKVLAHALTTQRCLPKKPGRAHSPYEGYRLLRSTWDPQFEPRPGTCRLIQTYTALVRTQDTMAERKPNAGSLSSRFRCEERVEYPVPYLGRDARPVISNRDDDISIRRAGLDVKLNAIPPARTQHRLLGILQ